MMTRDAVIQKLVGRSKLHVYAACIGMQARHK